MPNTTTPSAELALQTAAPEMVAVSDLPEWASAGRYYEAAKSENTRAAYAVAWRMFVRWCAASRVSASDAAPELVATYLAGLADAGRKFSTIAVALAGIAYTLGESGHRLDTRHPGLSRVMSGIRREVGVRPAKKTALVGGDIVTILKACGDTLGGKRDRALLALGWCGAFRRSELVALDVSDIAFTEDGIVATVRRSKTDQGGEGLSKAIPYASNPKVCAVRAVRAWLDASGVVSGPLFRAVDQVGRVGVERLGGHVVCRIVKLHAAKGGRDPKAFGGHSLRSGFITTAAKKGKALDAIMRQTGHKSHAVAMGYIQAASLFDDSAAAVGLL